MRGWVEFGLGAEEIVDRLSLCWREDSLAAVDPPRRNGGDVVCSPGGWAETSFVVRRPGGGAEYQPSS